MYVIRPVNAGIFYRPSRQTVKSGVQFL